MRHGLVCLGLVFFAGLSLPTEQQQQEKPKENAPATDAAKPAAATTAAATAGAATERKNPVKPSPEGMAAAKKAFGYDCAMCHGVAGDGKGDVAASMNLTLKDWRDPAVLNALTDAEMFDLISKGKNKMVGEGDRLTPEKTWGMVNYVRSFAKKEAAAATAPKS